MRGLGDFQRAQMREADPRIHVLFHHIREAVDVLEQLLLRPEVTRTVERPRPVQDEGRETDATLLVKPEKLAYTVREIQQFVGISRSAIYFALGSQELRAVKSVAGLDIGERPSGVVGEAATKILVGAKLRLSTAEIFRSMLPRLLP
jgi:hypothetical protein